MSTPSSSAELTILHLGLGSFHRAHQALYLHRLHQLGDTRWVIAGGNLRPDMPETMAALQAQGGAYTLETVTPQGERSYTRIESIRRVLPYQADLAPLIALAVAPSTRIISFTVTEAGYYLDANDRLDWLSFPDLRADLEAVRAGQAGHTLYGALTTLLRARMRHHGGPVTLLNCDNLRHNGERSRGGLLQFVEALGDTALADWVQTHTTSPNAMVDRITPRPTPDVAERVRAATGWDDRAPVVGHRYIHEGTHDPAIRKMAHDYVSNDAIPVLLPSPIDLAAYRDVVLDRFGNPAIQDTNQRVAMDGFAKIPGMIAPTIRDRLARGESIASVALLPPLFLACLQRWHHGTLPYAYQDQAMDPAAAHAICDAADPVAAFAADPTLWGELASDPRLVQALRDAFARVQSFIREHTTP